MGKNIEYNPIVNNYREMLEFATNKYKDNVAYKYKEDITVKPPKYIEKTYEQVGKDVKSLATALLNAEFKCDRVALISDNRYEWPISYFAITCSGKVVAPMDKMLPNEEIKALVKRSQVEAVVCDKKHLEVFQELLLEKDNKLQAIICMDNVEENNIINISSLLEEGNKLLETGDKKYDEVKINDKEMSIMLFTSGTTSSAKIVMLSQNNICSNVVKYQNHFMMLPSDTLLSFLPIHHTFESSITILYGFYSGATVAFCDGLRHIAENLKEYEVSIFVAVPLVLETMYKKINKGIAEQGKTGLINKMIKISNALRKCHIDVRRKLFKAIINNFGGKLRIILYGAASLDKDTIVGFDNFGIDSIQGY